MSRDFTYETYERLITAAHEQGYEFLTMREYLSRDDLPERFLIMRHDVDRKPANALDLAEIEADVGVSTSYYFRAIDKTFRPDILTSVADLGHEVGYHYEDVDTSDGDMRAAQRSFVDNLARFREYVGSETVAMHGNPLTEHDNRELWETAAFEDHGILGEVYLSVDFTDLVYFSDTNRTWYDERTIVNDWPVGPARKPEQIESTRDLIELVEAEQIPRLYLLTHPNRWAETTAEWVGEYAKDTVINAGKFGLWTLRSIRDDGQQPGTSKSD